MSTPAKVRHLIGDVGVARCGERLGLHQGGAVGGDQAAEFWEVEHVAMSAAGLLGWPVVRLEAIEHGEGALLLGGREMCYECTRRSVEALQLRGRDDQVPAWAKTARQFAEAMTGAWPDPWQEAEMSSADDFPLQGRRADR